jgi:hypothetical protein
MTSAEPAFRSEAALPAAVRQRVAELRARSRGPRTEAAWAAFRQRMAEINANLAIEDLALTDEELAFFELVFSLNVPESDEQALRKLWIADEAQAARASADAAE